MVIFLNIGIDDGHRGGLLVYDFKGHSKADVEEFVKSKMSGDEFMDEKESYGLCQFEIMTGGITPKAQPIDSFIGKVFKGHYREYYDSYAISAPINDNTGHIKPPTHQLCTQWVVKSWEKIPPELMRKSWTVCGYKSVSELEEKDCSINVNTVTEYTREDIVSIMETQVRLRVI